MKEQLQKVLGYAQNIFRRRGDSIVGVDIGTSAIKVVELRRKEGKAILETYGELALGPYANLVIGQATRLPVQKQSEAFKDVLREASVRTKSAGFSIAHAQSLVSIIDMPLVSGADLDDMVPMEARRYIPTPLSEVSLDWRLIPERGGPDTATEVEGDDGDEGDEGKQRKIVKIMIAAIHNETFNIYREIAKQANLNVSFFEIELFSSIRALLGKSKGTAMILDIGSATSKLIVVESGVPFTSHVINKGAQDITTALARSQGITVLRAEEMKREIGLSKNPRHKNAVEAMESVLLRIFSEADHALREYERKYHKTVDKVILSGGGSLLKNIFPIAEQSFHAEVVYGDPFANVEAPAFLEPVLKDAGPNFAVAIGLALRGLQELD